jgi:phosphatidate cytidylyltransferase
MIRRVLTALVMAPGAVLTILFAPAWVFLLLTSLVACGCFREFRRLAGDHGALFPPVAGLAAGLTVLLTPLDQGFLAVIIGVLATMALSMRNDDLALVLPQTAAASLGLLYCFATWRCGIGLRDIGPHWLLFALALNWIADAFAYFGGRATGRHKMAPSLSPAKTWEGALWSVAGSLLFGWIFLGHFVPERGLPEVLLLSLATNVAGQFGDLAESALKRGAGRKDSGSLLPGHGGWLDRMDSSLFSMPLVFLWLTHSR